MTKRACDHFWGIMVSIGLDFSDYHRTIIGFHGTDRETADRLVAGEPFRPSNEVDDWLGNGAYFWEYAPKQAWWWARKFKRKKTPAVVGAMIRLGNCFDLLDPSNVRVLRAVHANLSSKMAQAEIPLPLNSRHRRNLDCAVFNELYKLGSTSGNGIDSSRAVYVPTDKAKRIWRGSWIYDEAHIQICVRNQRHILAVWHAREEGGYGRGE